jgi:hypothetical protein
LTHSPFERVTIVRALSLASNMFRRVWSLGSAGVEVPLSVLRNTEKMELLVHSGDRAGFQRKGTLQ